MLSHIQTIVVDLEKKKQVPKICMATDTTNATVRRLYSDVIRPPQANAIVPSTASSTSSTSMTTLTLSTGTGASTQLSTLEDFNSLVDKKFEQLFQPQLARINATIASVQNATERVEQLEAVTKQVQSKQDSMSNDLSTSITTLQSTVETNMSTILQLLRNQSPFTPAIQSPVNQPLNSTTTTSPAISNISNSLLSQQSNTLPSTPTRVTQTYEHIASPPKRPKPSISTSHVTTSVEDETMMDTSQSFDDALMNVDTTSLQNPSTESRPLSTDSTSKSPHLSSEQVVEGQVQ